MSTTVREMTADDLWRLPDDGRKLELVQGELRIMAPAGFDHGAIGFDFGRELGNHVRSHKLGVVVGADTGFVLSRDPDTVRSPDVAFVRRDRVPKPRPVKFWDGAPDLAVEVVSPSDTVYEVDEKVQTWLDAGSQEVIVINPRQQTLRVVRRDAESKTLRPGDTLEGLESVPGFQCAVADIFE